MAYKERLVREEFRHHHHYMASAQGADRSDRDRLVPRKMDGRSNMVEAPGAFEHCVTWRALCHVASSVSRGKQCVTWVGQVNTHVVDTGPVTGCGGLPRMTSAVARPTPLP